MEAARLAREFDDEIDWLPDHFPLGGIHWYAGKGTDNKKHEHVGPMNALAHAALARDITPSEGWVFPAPKDASQPLGYHVIKGWLRKAERLAKVPHLPGGLWHPFRRGWATSRKHLPSGDVAKAGGWRDEATMRRCYVREDADTIVQAVNG